MHTKHLTAAPFCRTLPFFPSNLGKKRGKEKDSFSPTKRAFACWKSKGRLFAVGKQPMWLYRILHSSRKNKEDSEKAFRGEEWLAILLRTILLDYGSFVQNNCPWLTNNNKKNCNCKCQFHNGRIIDQQNGFVWTNCFIKFKSKVARVHTQEEIVI